MINFFTTYNDEKFKRVKLTTPPPRKNLPSKSPALLGLIKSDHTYIINNLKISDRWKIQLTIAINLISFKDKDEERLIHPKSDNKEIEINYKADEVIEKLFKLFLKRYQKHIKNITER